MSYPTQLPTNQRMFHGSIHSGALVDQLAARFNDRQHRTHSEQHGDSAVIQIGSKHGTPVMVHIADIAGGVLLSLSRSFAGEDHAPANPKVCPFCGTANPADCEHCQSCGGVLPVDLPRICPKCGRGHTSDALFCQACGTRLVEG